MNPLKLWSQRRSSQALFRAAVSSCCSENLFKTAAAENHWTEMRSCCGFVFWGSNTEQTAPKLLIRVSVSQSETLSWKWSSMWPHDLMDDSRPPSGHRFLFHLEIRVPTMILWLWRADLMTSSQSLLKTSFKAFYWCHCIPIYFILFLLFYLLFAS